MNKEDALKQLENTTKPNFIQIGFDYGSVFILPYEDGVTLMKCLKNAEILLHNYDVEKVTIVPFNDERFTAKPFPYQKYQDIKVAQLMSISYKAYIKE